jgi:hypothetical protein
VQDVRLAIPRVKVADGEERCDGRTGGERGSARGSGMAAPRYACTTSGFFDTVA